jgi:hypothetical protein
MIRMHCRKVHHPKLEFCEDCKHLLEYSEKRTENCRFGNDKPVCARCPVHCYKPELRNRIREVMRYSGPRMTIEHPYLALMHLMDKYNRKNGILEGWKNGKMEKWNDGIMEEWNDGRMEGWNTGILEEWNDGKMG